MTHEQQNILTEIATDTLGLDTLETQNSDGLDFHDLSVWGIKAALEAAFAAGQATGALSQTAKN